MVNRQAKILCGAPVKIDAGTFAVHCSTLSSQELWPGVILDFHHILDTHDADVEEVAREIGTVEFAADAVTPFEDPSHTHHWDDALFERVARMKESLFEKAKALGYSHFLLVDADLLLDSRTVKSLLSAASPIVSAVFWTKWDARTRESWGPNVWLRQPYGQEGLGMTQQEFWHRLMKRRLTSVVGGGACCLFEVEALRRGVRYHPRMNLPPEGMWRGEDRTLAESARSLHVPQAADPWPDIYHLYHEEDRDPEVVAEALEVLRAPRQIRAGYGDLVHFVLEPLIQGVNEVSVRGRLGELDLVPSLEAFLLENAVGTRGITEISLPFYWPRNAGKKFLAQVEIVDVKPYGFPPFIAQEVLQDVAAGA